MKVSKGVMMLTTTKPIPIEVIQKVKEYLQDDPRSLAFFTVMTNTGMRVGDMLNLTTDEVRWNEGMAEFFWKEQKTGKLRTVPLNEPTSKALASWLKVHPRKTNCVFEGARGKMHSPYMAQSLKSWCAAVGYTESRTSNHSMRKSFVKTHYERGTKLAVLMTMLNHETETQTLRYMGVLDKEVASVYASVI
jgi:integrase